MYIYTYEMRLRRIGNRLRRFHSRGSGKCLIRGSRLDRASTAWQLIATVGPSARPLSKNRLRRFYSACSGPCLIRATQNTKNGLKTLFLLHKEFGSNV